MLAAIVFVLNFEICFTGLSVSFVIGQSDSFGFGFTTLSEKSRSIENGSQMHGPVIH